jgi:2-oxoglutarate ferredoxin oxidoreductase subunit beta
MNNPAVPGGSREGLAVIEAVSYCHTTLGRINLWGTAPDMMRNFKGHSTTLKQAGQMSTEERRGKTVPSVFVDRDIPEYARLYEQIIERAQREAA